MRVLARGAKNYFCWGFAPKVEQVGKNNFYEMKGDVGMSLHEKERNKKMPTPRHKVTRNPIPTSLFLPRPQRDIINFAGNWMSRCFAVFFA